jgi:hypothetical protein
VSEAAEVLGPALTRERARELTDEVRRDAVVLWTKVVDLYDGGAHLALGYSAWGDYWKSEFGQSASRGDQLVRAGRVARILLDAGATLPANDLQARELVPVLRAAPAELPDVWARALEVADGQPSARMLRAVVAPYRESARPNRRTKQRAIGQMAIRRRRNLVAMPLANAHAAASSAKDALTEALRTAPDPDDMRAWLEHAEAARGDLRHVIGRLRRELDA